MRVAMMIVLFMVAVLNNSLARESRECWGCNFVKYSIEVSLSFVHLNHVWEYDSSFPFACC